MLVACLTATGRSASAQISLIRDAEIENTIRAFATPLFEAAGLSGTEVSIHLVANPELNAFVAGGPHLFLFTGLLRRVEHPGQLIGVIAHETGHIAAGHLARTNAALSRASAETILATVLGIAVAIVSGEPGAAAAVTQGGQALAQQNLLRYSRTQESAADQAGLRYLDDTGQSATGMLEFLDILAKQELLTAASQDAYLRTHPITRYRVGAVRHHVSESRFTSARISPRWLEMHARMLAKLAGFIDQPAKTLARYKQGDTSVAARYARAIAQYRRADLGKAVTIIDGLIRDFPDDPYFHELKGQMLFENGRVKEAATWYGNAVRLRPDSALLRMELARVQVETGDPALIEPAIRHLKEALRGEPFNSSGWQQLGIAYGRDDQIGMASVALAEAALLRGDMTAAVGHADRAMRTLADGSPAWLRAQDIKREAKAG
jgi:predicted Zn-dependent protease